MTGGKYCSEGMCVFWVCLLEEDVRSGLSGTIRQKDLPVEIGGSRNGTIEQR